MLKGKYKTTGYDTNGIARVYAVDSTQFMSKFLAQGEAWKYLNKPNPRWDLMPLDEWTFETEKVGISKWKNISP